ncbi:MAG: hypothetical protein ABL908_10575, partial [Hyphomicrobium sp.]
MPERILSPGLCVAHADGAVEWAGPSNVVVIWRAGRNQQRDAHAMGRMIGLAAALAGAAAL